MWDPIDEDGNDLLGWIVGLFCAGATAWVIWNNATTVRQGLVIGAVGFFVTMCAVFLARHDRLFFLRWW